MTKWDAFFEDKVKNLFDGAKKVMDIGGGLRATPNRGNRYDKTLAFSLLDLLCNDI